MAPIKLHRLTGLALACLCTLAVETSRAQTDPHASNVKASPTAITTNRSVAPPVRKSFRVTNDNVVFSTRFDGARLNSVERVGPFRYKALISPENQPINDSPWYSFSVQGKSEQSIQVALEYENCPHRYAPRISRDGKAWQLLGTNAVVRNGGNAYEFRLTIGPKPIYVSAQELITSHDFTAWTKSLQQHSFVKARVLGSSVGRKPIRALKIGENPDARLHVIITGRQHPPEVTGTMALKQFVAALCADTPGAKAFRKQFRTTVVPLLNPDGVDAGHWRHNANGADLNRDWGQFNQPETRLVRDEIRRITSNSGKVVFAMDFHSTRQDVFYISHPPDTGAGGDVAWEWLQAFRQRLSKPDHLPDADNNLGRNPARTHSFASWASATFRVPGITYEVGDNTDRARLLRTAQAGADAMMQVLLQEQTRIASPRSSAAIPVSLDPETKDRGAAPRKLKVALYKGAGTFGKGPSAIISHFDAGTNVVVMELSPSDIREGLLRKFDAVIFAGGSASKQAEMIGEQGREEVRDFVKNGGGYIGICAGAYLASSGFSWGLNLLDSRTVSPKWQRGEGVVKIKLTDLGSTCLANMPGDLDIKYQNGPILEPLNSPDLPDYEVLARFTTEVSENGTPKGIMTGAPAVLRGSYGKGRVMCFSPHPEQTPGLETLVARGLLWVSGLEEETALKQ